MEKYEKQIIEDIADIKRKEERRKRSLEKCKRQVNRFLKDKKYEELLALFQTEEVRELSLIDNHFANMSVILSIYYMEQNEKDAYQIFDGIDDMQDAEKKYLRIKFLVWRLEFTGDKVNVGKDILKNKISNSFLKYVIHTSSFDKAHTAYELGMVFKEEKRYVDAFSMLRYAAELEPEEIVFCEMADICVKMKQYLMAETCIRQIKTPSSVLEEYQKLWEITLNEQE